MHGRKSKSDPSFPGRWVKLGQFSYLAVNSTLIARELPFIADLRPFIESLFVLMGDLVIIDTA
jgi:hypothetical protein